MDGDAKVLQQIIQLVVLTIGLVAALKVIKERNDLMRTVSGYADKVGNATWGKALRKGDSVVKGGLASGVKNQGLNTEARMAASNNRLLKRAGGYRTRRSMNKKLQEQVRGQIQEEAYYGHMVGNDPRQGEVRRQKTVGGVLRNTDAAQESIERLGRQASGYASTKARERLNEELKHEALKLEVDFAPGDTTGLIAALNRAMSSGDEVSTRAIMARLAQEGKGAVSQMGDAIQAQATAGTLSGDVQRAISEQRQADWGTIKAADPQLAALDLSNGSTAATAVAPEQLASMSGARLQQLAASGKITTDMVGEAASKGMLAGLDDLRRANLEQGLSGNGVYGSPPVPVAKHNTIEELRVKHEAAATQKALSDRRLKKDIIFVGYYKDIPLYKFKYKGHKTTYIGTMAQDIVTTHSNAVTMREDGFYEVDYSKLGFKMQIIKE